LRCVCRGRIITDWVCISETHTHPCPGIWANVTRIVEKMKSILRNHHDLVSFESIGGTWPASRLLLNSLSILYILLGDEPVEDPGLLRVKRIMESSNPVFLYSNQNKLDSIPVLWNCKHGCALTTGATMKFFGQHSLCLSTPLTMYFPHLQVPGERYYCLSTTRRMWNAIYTNGLGNVESTSCYNQKALPL